MWAVLQGMSCETDPAGLGASAVPRRLYRVPVPSGRGKKMDPYKKERERHDWLLKRFQEMKTIFPKVMVSMPMKLRKHKRG